MEIKADHSARPNKSFLLKNSIVSAVAAICLLLATANAYGAGEDHLRKGIGAFNQGQFKAAVDHFGAALPTDFNNAVLHYYLANSYVHLKQREACIREFRIAYALDPNQEVGKLSKQALTTLGVGSFDDIPQATPGPPKTATKRKLELPKDPHFEQALKALRNQSSALEPALPVSQDPARRKAIQNAESRLIRSLLMQKNTRDIPDATIAQIEQLKALYAREGGVGQQSHQQTRGHARESASNLESLLNEKKGRHRLVPHGTNLYVRNYQSMDSDDQEKKELERKQSADKSRQPQRRESP